MPRTTRSTESNSFGAWRNSVFAIFALNGFFAAAWASRLPSIRQALHLDPGSVGLLITGMSGGAIIGLLLASHVLAWVGPRRTMGGMLLLQGAGVIGVGIGVSVLGSFPVTYLALAVCGAAGSTCDVAMNVEGALVEQRAGRTLLPLMHASWSLGLVLGSWIGAAAAFANLAVGWHALAVAALGMLLVPVLGRNLPLQRENAQGEVEQRSTLRERLAVFLEPRTILIGVIMLAMSFSEGSANDWLQLLLVDNRGFAIGAAASMFAVFTIAMTAGRVGGNFLVDRLGRVPMLRASVGFAIVGIALVCLVPSLWATIVGTVLWGLGASLGFPLGMSAAADDPEKAGARVGAVATVGYFAFLVGPVTLGALGDAWGLDRALLLVAVLAVFAFLASPAARESGARARATA